MDTLVVKGQKRVSGRSSNTKGSDNIISTRSWRTCTGWLEMRLRCNCNW